MIMMAGVGGDTRINKNSLETKRKQENLGDLLVGGSLKTIQDVEAKLNSSDLELFDECIKWSITPLMVACVLGHKDIVKFLLERGANPNKKSTDELNTPLHYACLEREYFEKDSFELHSGFWFQYADCNISKKEIIQLLFDHGAVLEKNTRGFLPIHCAALFAMDDIVDYFISIDLPLTDADKLMAMEILGVSQSFLLHLHPEAYLTFVSALLIRRDIRCELSSPKPTGFGQHSNSTECTNFDEVHKLKDDACKSPLLIHGLLVGERILPEELKQRFLWPIMMSAFDEAEPSICACLYGVTLEMTSKLKVGTVLRAIHDFMSNNYFGYPTLPKFPEIVLIKIDSCLEQYYQILRIVEPLQLAVQSVSIASSLGHILSEVLWRSSFDKRPFDLLFQTIVGVIKVYSEQTVAYNSVGIQLFEGVVNLCRYHPNDRNRNETRNLLALLNNVLPTVLKYEQYIGSECRTGNPYGCNMLHLTIGLLYQKQDVDVITALTHKLVRHGCPIVAMTSQGKTARSIALEAAAMADIDLDELQEILALVSKPSKALSLQELTSRCILRSKIPYSRATVPSTVYDFLNGKDFL